MARIWSDVTFAGCGITTVLKEFVEPSRAAMAPPKQYDLARNPLSGMWVIYFVALTRWRQSFHNPSLL